MIRFYKKPLNMGLLFFIAGILSILSFPCNPLVIFEVIKPLNIKVLWYMGWIVWATGMTLIGFAYYYIYIRKAKVFIKHGIYKLIRHPLYMGWILSVFIATIFLYQHWIFIVIGTFGVATLYLISIEEERLNNRQFGNSYKNYMEKVPRMNLVLGFIKILKKNNLN
jgi:protein-S-isoprenylcysteine O-methyltransferase Ste14